jgi:hypothetical protein
MRGLSWFSSLFKPNTEVVPKVQDATAHFSCCHPYLNKTKLISFIVQPSKLFLELLTSRHSMLLMTEGRAGQT